MIHYQLLFFRQLLFVPKPKAQSSLPADPQAQATEVLHTYNFLRTRLGIQA
jgi:hypothetical protein